jgi:hypothetical protein
MTLGDDAGVAWRSGECQFHDLGGGVKGCGLSMVPTWMVTMGGEFGGAAGVHVTMSRVSSRVPSFFLKVVKPLTVVMPELGGS